MKFDSFNYYSRVFDFGSGETSDIVYLSNQMYFRLIEWGVYKGSNHEYISRNFIYGGKWDPSIWTHVVVTVKGETMKFYKNGLLAGTNNDGYEPNIMTRTHHIIGAANWGDTEDYFYGTIAYLKVSHGVELTESYVTSLYAPYNSAIYVSGMCYLRSDLNGIYSPRGFTLSGRPWYKNSDGKTIYWEPNCDGGYIDALNGWVFDSQTPKETAPNDLDGE